jgi:hypothetical protein
VVVDRLHELLDAFVEAPGVHVVHLEERQELLVALGVLGDGVLDVVLLLRALALEGRVHLGLLGLRVGDEQIGQLPQAGPAVLLAVAQDAEEALELAVVGQDQLHDVAGVEDARTARGRIGHVEVP